MSPFRKHNGTACPVEPDDIVVIKFRNGMVQDAKPARHWRWKAWSWGQSDFDITAWRRAA